MLDGQRSSSLTQNQFGVKDSVRMAHSRAGHGLTPISLSFRAARIVAAKRIAYFRCSSIESSGGNGACRIAQNQMESKPAIEVPEV
jgi:hypothetical protein